MGYGHGNGTAGGMGGVGGLVVWYASDRMIGWGELTCYPQLELLLVPSRLLGRTEKSIIHCLVETCSQTRCRESFPPRLPLFCDCSYITKQGSRKMNWYVRLMGMVIGP